MNKYTFNFREVGYVDEDNFDEASYAYGENREVNYSVDVSSDAQWSAVLRNFLNFLSSVYGYDISDKVDYDGKD